MREVIEDCWSFAVIGTASGWIGGLLCVMALGGCNAAEVKAFSDPAKDALLAIEIAQCVQDAVTQEQVSQLRASVMAQPTLEAQPEAATKSAPADSVRVPSTVGHEVDKMMRVQDAGPELQ